MPRIINVIADRAMLGAYTQDELQVSVSMVRRAAAEVYGEDPDLKRNTQGWLYVAGFAALAALLIGLAAFTAMRFIDSGTPATAQLEDSTEQTAEQTGPLWTPDIDVAPAAGTPATDPADLDDLKSLVLANLPGVSPLPPCPPALATVPYKRQRIMK